MEAHFMPGSGLMLDVESGLQELLSNNHGKYTRCTSTSFNYMSYIITFSPQFRDLLSETPVELCTISGPRKRKVIDEFDSLMY